MLGARDTVKGPSWGAANSSSRGGQDGTCTDMGSARPSIGDRRSGPLTQPEDAMGALASMRASLRSQKSAEAATSHSQRSGEITAGLITTVEGPGAWEEPPGAEGPPHVQLLIDQVPISQ